MGGLTRRQSINFPIALDGEKAHTSCMITVARPHHLCGWSVRCASVALSLAFCASLLADPSKNVVVPAKQQPAQKRVMKVCYVMISGFGIPQRCDRLTGIPTTAYPMEIIGR